MKVKLPAELTVCHVVGLRQELLQALHKEENVELDAREVTEVDVAGMQLLCALHRDLTRLGTTMTLIAPDTPGPMQSICDRGGFRRKVGCVPGCLWVEAKHG